MAKSFAEYLRDAEANGLYKPAATQPRDVFGNLASVKGVGGDEAVSPLTPLKWAIDIVSRPEFAVTNAIKGQARRQAEVADAAAVGRTPADRPSIFTILGDAWTGLTSTRPEDQNTGAELISSLGEIENRNNPGYDPESIPDFNRGVGGLALDIALDPLTYATGGLTKLIGQGAKAATKAVKGAKVVEEAPVAVRAAQASDGAARVRANEFDEALADDMLELDVPPAPRAVSDATRLSPEPASPMSKGPAEQASRVAAATDDVEAPFMVHFMDDTGKLTSQAAQSAEQAKQFAKILRDQYKAKPIAKGTKISQAKNTYQIVSAGEEMKPYSQALSEAPVRAPQLASPELSDLGQGARESLVDQMIAAAPATRQAPPTRAEDLASLRDISGQVADSQVWQRARPVLERIREVRETGFVTAPETRGARVAMIRDWLKTTDPRTPLAYRPGLKPRPLAEWVQRRAAAAKSGDQEIFNEADEVVQKAFDESPLGQTYRDSLRAENAFTGINDYAAAIRTMRDGLDTLTDVLPSNVSTLLLRNLENNPERFEKLMSDMLDAVAVRPSAIRFLAMDNQLRIRMMNAAGIDKVSRSNALSTVARVLTADQATKTEARLGSTANNIWRRWATTHLKKAKTFQYQTLSGAKTNVPTKGKGQAIYADEINAYGQYDRAKRINDYYLKVGSKGEKEFVDFVYAKRLEAAGGNTRAVGVKRPKNAADVFGPERWRAVLEFQIKKFRELDEIDDFYGFRSQLLVGPVDRAAALETFEDRIPLSIGDVYETLYKSALGTPLEPAMLRVLGNHKTAVPPTQLLEAIVSRFKGEADDVFDSIATAEVKRGNGDVLANNLAKGGQGEHFPARKGIFEELGSRLGPGEKIVPSASGKGYWITHSPEQLVGELRAVVDNAMPLLKAAAGDNALAFASKAADEVDFLSSTMLKELDDVVSKGRDGDLVEAIMKRRQDMERLAVSRQTYLASKQAALDVQDGLMSIGGADALPRAQRLNIIENGIDKYLYPAVLDYQRKSNAFGLTGKHGGKRTASVYVAPTDAEIRAAIKHLADEGSTSALERWQVISRSGRIANKDRHNSEFVKLAVKTRAERETKEALRTAEAKKMSDSEIRSAAKNRRDAADYADRVTRAQHVKEDEDVLAEFQAEAQAAKEGFVDELLASEAALDAGDVATATRVLEQHAEFVDLLGRTSGPRVDQTTGRMIDAFGRRFIKDHEMKTLYPYVFKESQLAGQFVTSMKRQLMDVAKLAGVTQNAAIRGSVLPVAFSNLQRGLPGGELQAVQDGFENVIRDILPTDSSNWMSSMMFRNSQKVDELNEFLRMNGLKGSDIGRPDGNAFDWEAAVKAAQDNGTQPADELMEQWRQWRVDDPVTTLAKITQAAAELNQRKAIAADFHVFADRAGWVSDTAQPGYVRITASGKGSTFGGFIDTEKFYRKEFAAELKRADEFMREPRQLQNEFLRKYYIPLLNTWKWSITLPRPGHHIRNMIGDWSIQTVARGIRGFAQAQQDAIKILGTNARYDGVDIMAAFERRPGDALPKGGDTLVRSDKYGDFTVDELFAALNDQGLRPTYHAGEGLFGDEALTSTYSRILDKATIIKDTRLGEKIGQFSEYRDHYARAGHFMQALRQEAAKGKYANREELLAAVGAEVRKYHPDATMLTPFEARYMRNIIPFYSWFRGVLPAIVESSARHPNRVMVFPKVSYNLAVANGLDPESFANPFPDDQLFPDFIASQVTGPQFQLPDGTYISMNPGIAHLDVFNTLGGGSPEAAVRGVLGMVSPIIRVPAELAGNSRWSTGQPIRDVSDYLDSSIPGVNYLSNITGVSPTGSVTSILSGQGLDPQEQVSRGVREPIDQGISAFNWLSGLGAQNVSKENYQRLAEIQRRDAALEEYKRSQ